MFISYVQDDPGYFPPLLMFGSPWYSNVDRRHKSETERGPERSGRINTQGS